MIALKRILVPIDFSETSEAALGHAVPLASAFSASMYVLHVVRRMLAETGKSEAWRPPLSLSEKDQGGVQEELRKLLERQTPTVQAQALVKVGSPFLEIVRCAKEMDIDLIVMGTHGRGPVAHMLIGSVAERVVRTAPCPVLTVRHPTHKFVMP
jgi:nucleotide-binding universal stress UspA family protein